MVLAQWTTNVEIVVEQKYQAVLMTELVTITHRPLAMMVLATLVHAPGAPIQQHVITYPIHLSMMDHVNLIHAQAALTQQHVTTMLLQQQTMVHVQKKMSAATAEDLIRQDVPIVKHVITTLKPIAMTTCVNILSQVQIVLEIVLMIAMEMEFVTNMRSKDVRMLLLVILIQMLQMMTDHVKLTRVQVALMFQQSTMIQT